MWEGLHILLGEAAELPPLDPRPGADIRDRVLALAVTGEVVAGFAGILAAQLDLEYAVDAEGFVAETFNSVCVSSIRVNMLFFIMGRKET